MNILVTMPEGQVRSTFLTEFSMERLNKLGNVTLNPYDRNYTKDELKAALKGIDIVFCCWGSASYDEEILEAADSLKVIAYCAGSVAGVATPAVYEKNIAMLAANCVLAESVVESCICYKMVGLRRIKHYTTNVDNAILSAKVSYDAENFYFLATTKEAVNENSKGFMNLYINADRNRATGWEGYDFALNVEGKGVISKATGNAWAWANVGTAVTKVNGNNYMAVIPRSVLGETGTVDFEFKWTDSIDHKGDLLKFYVDGSSAPYGRFNYLYTEIQQTTLSANERAALKGTSIRKAGAENMIVSGAKMDIYEKNTRVRAFEMNGTLYVPGDIFEEIMGFGRAKVEYDPNYNVFFTHHFDLSENEQSIVNYIWTVSALDSTEVRVDGAVKTMSAPVIAKDNMVWAPISLLADCYGWNVQNLGNGVYTVSENAPDLNTVNAVLSHLN